MALLPADQRGARDISPTLVANSGAAGTIASGVPFLKLAYRVADKNPWMYPSSSLYQLCNLGREQSIAPLSHDMISSALQLWYSQVHPLFHAAGVHCSTFENTTAAAHVVRKMVSWVAIQPDLISQTEEMSPELARALWQQACSGAPRDSPQGGLQAALSYMPHLIEVWMGAHLSEIQLGEMCTQDLWSDFPGPHCLLGAAVDGSLHTWPTKAAAQTLPFTPTARVSFSAWVSANIAAKGSSCLVQNLLARIAALAHVRVFVAGVLVASDTSAEASRIVDIHLCAAAKGVKGGLTTSTVSWLHCGDGWLGKAETWAHEQGLPAAATEAAAIQADAAVGHCSLLPAGVPCHSLGVLLACSAQEQSACSAWDWAVLHNTPSLAAALVCTAPAPVFWPGTGVVWPVGGAAGDDKPIRAALILTPLAPLWHIQGCVLVPAETFTPVSACTPQEPVALTLGAPHVVCTLPAGVLQANPPVFEPPLPQWKQDAIKRLGNGRYCKVILCFEQEGGVFWPEDAPPFWGIAGCEDTDLGSLASPAGLPPVRYMENYLSMKGVPALVAVFGKLKVSARWSAGSSLYVHFCSQLALTRQQWSPVACHPATLLHT